jgi:hypothetical protein
LTSSADLPRPTALIIAVSICLSFRCKKNVFASI